MPDFEGHHQRKSLLSLLPSSIHSILEINEFGPSVMSLASLLLTLGIETSVRGALA